MSEKPTTLQSMPQQYLVHYQDDEVSLVDIAILFYKFRKYFFVSLMMLAIVGTVLVVLTHEDRYLMGSILSVGKFKKTNGSDFELIEQPADTVSKITQSILPDLTLKYMDEYQLGLFKTEIRVPEGTNQIVIENEVSESSVETFSKFQKSVMLRVLSDHKNVIAQFNSALKHELITSRINLEKLQDPSLLDEKVATDKIRLIEEQNALNRLLNEQYQLTQKGALVTQIEIAENEMRAYLSQNEALEVLLEQISSENESDRAKIRSSLAENNLAIQENRSKILAWTQQLNRFDENLLESIARQKAVVHRFESEINLAEGNLVRQIELKKEEIKDLEEQISGAGSQIYVVGELSSNPVNLSLLKKQLIVMFAAIVLAFIFTIGAIFRQKVVEKMASEV